MDATFAPYLAALLGLGLNFTLPLGLPPRPLDPVIERAAPDECLCYLSWAGVAAADPNSENQTERLLAEAEVRDFLAALDGQLAALAHWSFAGDDDEAGSGKARQAAIDEAPRMLKILLTHPAAIFISALSMAGPGQLGISGGMVIHAGDQLPELEAWLASLSALPAAGADAARPDAACRGACSVAAEAAIGGVACRRLPLPPGVPEICWGSRGGYVMFGVGKQGLEGLIARIGDDRRTRPAWLARLHETLQVERVSQVFYIDALAAARALGPPRPDPAALPVYKALGVGSIRSVSAVTGLNRNGMLSRAIIDCRHNPTGLAELLGASLDPEDCKAAPADSSAIALLRLPAERIYDAILEIAASPGPAGAAIDEAIDQPIHRAITAFEEVGNISIRDDLFGSLGDLIHVYGPAAGDGDPLSGLVTISIRDRARLAKAEKAIVAYLEHKSSAQPGVFRLEKSTSGGRETRSLRVAGLPIAPAWTIADNELIVGMPPRAVSDYLVRPAGGDSRPSAERVAERLRRREDSSLLIYLDLNRCAGRVHGTYQSLRPLANARLAATGVPFSFPPLPPLAAIRPHARSSMLVARRTSAGLVIEREQTAPLIGDAIALAPVALVLAAPAIWSARAAAQRNAGANNLEQIGLGLRIQRHAAEKPLPASAIIDPRGKPLLSWRVRLLPELEQGELYKQFHLDEPWDSEHNRKLVDRMPNVYAMPGADLDSGKTTYLAITAERAPLSPDKNRSLPAGAEEASKIVMVVEARPDRAVEWTRPDDLPADSGALRALVGARRGGFNALLGDGTVRFLSDAIDPRVFQSLLGARGGESADRRAVVK